MTRLCFLYPRMFRPKHPSTHNDDPFQQQNAGFVAFRLKIAAGDVRDCIGINQHDIVQGRLGRRRVAAGDAGVWAGNPGGRFRPSDPLDGAGNGESRDKQHQKYAGLPPRNHAERSTVSVDFVARQYEIPEMQAMAHPFLDILYKQCSLFQMEYTFQWREAFEQLPYLLGGAWVTLHLSFLGFWAGCTIGLFGALTKTYGPRWLIRLVDIYVVFFTNTPGLVTAFFIFFGLPEFGIVLPPYEVILLNIALNSGAYITEVMRGGFLSVRQTEVEAATSMGFSLLQRLRYVIVPHYCQSALRTAVQLVHLDHHGHGGRLNLRCRGTGGPRIQCRFRYLPVD